MSKTGTYAHRDGKLVKVSEAIPSFGREVTFNDHHGYFDKSARKYFNTKREKRSWLKENKMREAGIYGKAPINGEGNAKKNVR